MNEHKQNTIWESEQQMPDLHKDTFSPTPIIATSEQIVETTAVARSLKSNKPAIRFLFHDVYPKSFGIIESNQQIIRNESGQTKHKEFTGIYEKSLKNAPIVRSGKPVNWILAFALWIFKMFLFYLCLKYLLH